MSPSEIETAIQRAFDGSLSTEDCLRLRNILKSDPTARALYFEHAALHQLLIYRLSRSTPLDAARSLTDTRLKLQTRRSARTALAIAAAIVLLLGITLMRLLAPEPAVLATFETDTGARFTLQYPDSDSPPPSSNEIHEGTRILLDQGTLEVKIRKGSRAVILAPAILRIDSDTHMTLDQGTAWFEIGKDAAGFEVTTPQLSVTDLGTRFGVLALPDANHEIHVFSGKVIARGRSGTRSEETLTTGMARLCDPIGRLKTTPLRPEFFLSLLPQHHDSELIINGGFENGNPPPPSTYGPHANAAFLPGWRFGNEIIVMRATTEGIPGYGEKSTTILSSTKDTQVGFSQNFHGPPPNPDDVSIYQTFATKPGQTYQVQFEMGAIFFGPSTLKISASVHQGATPSGPTLASHTEQRSSSAGNGYNPPATLNFTASSPTSTLIFTEISEHSVSSDPVIDNISVTEIP